MESALSPPQAGPIQPRQSDILLFARQSGRVKVEQLARRFEVTPQTIRKDLNELCQRGLLQRVHGGAVATSGVANFGYEARRSLAAAGKRLIGQATAALIPNDCSILINIGTTTEQVAMALRTKQGLMAITNNINVVNILAGYSDIEIVVAGGVVRHADCGIVGEGAADFIKQFKVDYGIIGASAIDPDGSLLDYDYREVKVAQAIIANARKTILVADAMKFERSAPVRIGHLAQLSCFVTDKPLPAPLAQVCRESELQVIVAEGSESPASAH